MTTTRKRKDYPGCLDRHGNGYRWRVSVGGTRHVLTLRTSDRKEAVRFVRSKHVELETDAERDAEGMPGQVTMKALFDQFELEVMPTLSPGGQRSYADSLLPLRIYFVDEGTNQRVDQVKPKHVHGYLTWRRAHRLDGHEGIVSARTQAKDRSVLHTIFDLAETLGYRDGNPVRHTKKIKSDDRTPVILSAKQYEQLLEACGDREMLKFYVLVLGETGMRSHSEALWLRWEDVDLEGGFVQVVSGRDGHRTKSGKTRWTPMTPRLAQAMKAHFARYRFVTYGNQPTPWLFHLTCARRSQPAGARIQSFYRSFKAAAKRAKLSPDFVQHDLRHRRVTTWLAEGQSPVLVKEAVGHANLATTMGYTHLVKEHLRPLASPPAMERDQGREQSA
ncbi:MAG: tyrosine-type recombinase/integrase [Gemmatimonadetes bacterium]|nr:tyrosine-type recombinase/integrase [Gemmatimonadota bacterium]